MKPFIANAPKPAPSVVTGSTAAGTASAASAVAHTSTNNGHGSNTPEKVGPYNFEVEVNQKSYKVAVHELVAPGAPAARVGSAAPAKPSARSLDRPGKGTNKSGSGSGEVKAPMHGVVKELLVGVGDAVTSGQKTPDFSKP